MDLNEIKKHELLKQASIYSYNVKHGRLPEGYQLLGIAINEKTGFYACVLKKDKDIIIAYRGTDFPRRNDLGNDLKMPFSKLPAQAKDALELYDRTCKEYPSCKVTVTGHSLGGSLAQIVAGIRNACAVTFNAFGTRNVLQNRVERIYSDNIINYCNPDDIFTTSNGLNHIGKCYKINSNDSNVRVHFVERMQPLKNRIETNVEELDFLGRKLKKEKEENDYYLRSGQHMPMFMGSMCAGSYPVSGYTREDGTKVNGYIRTCGAKHLNS